MRDFQRTVLEDGLEVVSAPQPGARSVSLGCWLDVGSRDEADEDAGVAHLLEHLAFKGTSKHTARDLAEMFDAIGGDLNAFTTKEATCFHARVLADDLAMTIEVVAELVQRPLLAPSDVEVERRVVLEEIAMHEDTPEDLVGDLLAEAMFPGQAVGRRIQGFASTIGAVPQERIEGFHGERYPASRAIVAASGATDHDRLVDLVRSTFEVGTVRRGLREEATPAVVNGVRVVASRDVEQSHLVLAVPGIARRDPRRWTMALLNAALGGGMSSRLFQRIREERGLAYHVASGNQGFANTGMFSIYAGCGPESVGEVASLARDIVAEVVTDGITDAELSRARGFLRGGMLLGFEDPGGLMTHLAKSALFHGEILTPDELLAKLDEVTLDGCRALAREILGGSWSLAVIGPDSDPRVEGFDLSERAA